MPEGLPAAPPAELNYWRETRQPIYSAWLILPFLLAYELGLHLLRSDVINGGDAILLNLGGTLMRALGLGTNFVSVIVLLAVFLIAQIHTKGPWRVKLPLLVLLFLESLLYAVLLFVLLGYLIQYLPSSREPQSMAAARTATLAAATDAEPAPQPQPKPGAQPQPKSNTPATKHSTPQPRAPSAPLPRAYETVTPAAPVPPATPGSPATPPVIKGTPRQPVPLPPPQRVAAASSLSLRDFVLFCGAGVYEELVFRVILLSLLLLVFHKLFHMESAYAAVWAVAFGAVIFSAFHHIDGQEFRAGVFLQRCIAGLYFAAVYYNRSFGVAAAAHALYDILVGINQLLR